MDPSVFFGRSRQTRQTLKLKQESSAESNVISKVSLDTQKNSEKPTTRGRKVKIVVGGKENDAAKDCTAKTTVKGIKKAVNKKNPGSVNEKEDIHKPTSKTSKVCIDKQKSPSKESTTSGQVPSGQGPVYQNVRRSDVVGDPYNEYDFPAEDSDSDPAPKKKRTKKANPSKKMDQWYGTVKWAPNKRPCFVKPKQSKKQTVKKLDPGIPTKVSVKEKAAEDVPPNNLKHKELVSAPTVSDLAVKMSAPIRSKELRSAVLNPLVNVRLNITSCSEGTSPNFSTGNPFTSTPVSRRAILSNLSSNKAQAALAGSSSPVAQKDNVQLPQPVCREKRKAVDTNESCSSKCLKPSSTSSLDNPSKTTPVVEASARTVASSPVTSLRHSAFASCSPVSVRSICVRESPSFMEAEPVVEPAVNSVSRLSIPVCPEGSGVTSTPVTRSKAASMQGALKQSPGVCFTLPQSSDSQSTLLPVHTSNSPVNSSFTQENDCGNLSGLFDDVPRTLPKRMFSTHRGTIFVPNGENITKRKMPELSPNKGQDPKRPTTVKFSAASVPVGVDDCFGFGDEDPMDIPHTITGSTRSVRNLAQHAKEQKSRTPRLSVQEVQAILRGQAKLVSPANSTPRSVQTKLTDFICSTPNSIPERVVAQINAEVLTPTPVPLFGEELINSDLPSPFMQPSRRSYDRFKPAKRIAYGDQVYSDDEGEDPADHVVTKDVPNAKTKNKSYRKKKKKPVDDILDNWANQLASHFDEVEAVELLLD